jgi:hypothetical protein
VGEGPVRVRALAQGAGTPRRGACERPGPRIRPQHPALLTGVYKLDRAAR